MVEPWFNFFNKVLKRIIPLNIIGKKHSSLRNKRPDGFKLIHHGLIAVVAVMIKNINFSQLFQQLRQLLLRISQSQFPSATKLLWNKPARFFSLRNKPSVLRPGF